MPTLYSSTIQTSTSQKVSDKTNQPKDMPISTSVSAKNNYDKHIGMSNNISKANVAEFDNNTLVYTEPTNLPGVNNTDINNTCDKDQQQSKYFNGSKISAPYRVNDQDKTILQSQKDDGKDMYCSPVDVIQDDSSRNATNSLILNNALYNTNDNSSVTDKDNMNNESHGNDDDDDTIAVNQVKNQQNV